MNSNTSLSAISNKAGQAVDSGIAAAERTADRLTDSAEDALRITQRTAHNALGSLSSSVDELRHAVPAAMHRAADSARHAGDSTVSYIRHEPLKSVLVAAAIGALAVGLLAVFSRSDR